MGRRVSRMSMDGSGAPSRPRNILPPPLPLWARTADDLRIHSSAPPVCSAPRNARDFSWTREDGEEIAVTRRHLARDKESTGWLTSLAVHVAIIVLIGLLLAPADFSGDRSTELIVTFTEEQEEIDLEETEVDLEVGVFENKVVGEELDQLPEVATPPPLRLSLNDLFSRTGAKGRQTGGSPQKGGGGGAGEKSWAARIVFWDRGQRPYLCLRGGYVGKYGGKPVCSSDPRAVSVGGSTKRKTAVLRVSVRRHGGAAIWADPFQAQPHTGDGREPTKAFAVVASRFPRWRDRSPRCTSHGPADEAQRHLPAVRRRIQQPAKDRSLYSRKFGRVFHSGYFYRHTDPYHRF